MRTVPDASPDIRRVAEEFHIMMSTVAWPTLASEANMQLLTASALVLLSATFPMVFDRPQTATWPSSHPAAIVLVFGCQATQVASLCR